MNAVTGPFCVYCTFVRRGWYSISRCSFHGFFVYFCVAISLSLLARFNTCLSIPLWITFQRLRTSWIVTTAARYHCQTVIVSSFSECCDWTFTISMWLSPLCCTWAFDSSEPIFSSSLNYVKPYACVALFAGDDSHALAADPRFKSVHLTN